MDVDTMFFEPSDWVPNNQRLPVLRYNVDLSDGESFETLFAKNRWSDIWADGVFDYQHYHTGAHEVLGVKSGSATLLIGGPDGQKIRVAPGDCLILPAGTGHQNLGSRKILRLLELIRRSNTRTSNGRPPPKKCCRRLHPYLCRKLIQCKAQPEHCSRSGANSRFGMLA